MTRTYIRGSTTHTHTTIGEASQYRSINDASRNFGKADFHGKYVFNIKKTATKFRIIFQLRTYLPEIILVSFYFLADCIAESLLYEAMSPLITDELNP